MEDLQGWPKFQWSKFTNGKDEQVVIRSNNYEEFIVDVEKAKTDFVGHSPVQKTVTETSTTSQHYCETHSVEMKQRNFNGKTWYDHRKKEGDTWLICYGQGFKEQGGE